MKSLGLLAVLGFLGFGGYTVITAPPSVEAATASVKKSTVAVKEAATVTKATAASVSQTIDSPDRGTKLPDELVAFNRSTERLTTLRNNLRTDMMSYKVAYDEKLTEFDKQAGEVTDEHIKRSLANLRRQ